MMAELDAESIATLAKAGVATLSIALGSKPAAIFVERISSMVGWILDPTTIKRKARAEAVASIIKAEADLEIEAIARRAAARVLDEEKKYQANLESVILNALASIKEDAEPNKVEDDWLNSFFDKCRKFSNVQTQLLWSKILSGEVNQPGRISLRTLDFLTTLTKEEADAFVHLCSYAWLDASSDFVHKINAEYVSKMIITDYMDEQQMYGIDKTHGSDIFYFQGIGVLMQEPVEVKLQNIKGGPIELTYHDRRFKITQLAINEEIPVITAIPTGRVKFTQVGRELSLICEPSPNWEYMNYMIDTWKSQGFEVIELLIPSI